jgi:hypothetical protein
LNRETARGYATRLDSQTFLGPSSTDGIDVLDHLSTALAGHYSVRGELGRGGMATVYLAQGSEARSTDRREVLDPELAATLSVWSSSK